MKTKRLRDLFPDSSEDTEIRDLRINSRDVRPGDLFICTKGATADRHDFAKDAVARGAAAVVASRPVDVPVPVVYVENTNAAMPHIAAALYDHPEREMHVTAITGTNGKTTVATILSEMLGQEKCGYIGTNGICCAAFDEPIRNSCPDADRMYPYLRRLRDAGCDSAVLEATSEALHFGRLDTFRFDTVIFTNITQDHLNTHKTVENYVNAKLLLLGLIKDDAVVILNRDDRYYERERAAAGAHRVVTYGKDPEADLCIQAIEGVEGGTKITLGGRTFLSPMIGDFNAYNLAAAFCAMMVRGIPLDECIRRTDRIRPVAGRMEALDFGQKYQVILDYAHTPDAFRKILPYLAEHKKGRLITITGSAGGREKEKRPEMGRLVLDYSDLVIFTMDDPRTEDVNEIIDDLLSGSEKMNYLRIPDRKEAIWKALSMAEPDDTVLVAGKGRDNYMALGTEYLPYCDYDTIKEFYS